jgi:hypothetical protein
MEVSVNIANVVSADVDGESGVFVMDPSSGKVYSLALSEVDPSVAGRIFMAAMGQSRADMFELPHEQISEVMKAKDGVFDSNKKAFGGGFDARG